MTPMNCASVMDRIPVSLLNRFALGLLLVGCAAGALTPAARAADAPACDPNNGGITLPAGFCAFLAADGLGEARHITVAPMATCTWA